MCRATWVQFLHSAETLLSPVAILRGTEPVIGLTRAFICSRYNLFLLEFHLWQSCTDSPLNLM